MSLVGEPFGNCLKPSYQAPRTQPKPTDSEVQEPQETFRSSEPFGNCWRPNTTPTAKAPKPEAPPAEPQDYRYDPREPFRYPGNI